MSNERSRHELGTKTLAAVTRDAGIAVIESLKDMEEMIFELSKDIV